MSLFLASKFLIIFKLLYILYFIVFLYQISRILNCVYQTFIILIYLIKNSPKYNGKFLWAARVASRDFMQISIPHILLGIYSSTTYMVTEEHPSAPGRGHRLNNPQTLLPQKGSCKRPSKPIIRYRIEFISLIYHSFGIFL